MPLPLDPPIPPRATAPALTDRRWGLLTAALILIGLALVLYAYWPGVMIDDARWQYQQVVDNAYEDWHPPLMAWTWRRLTMIAPGPGPLLAVQLGLIWGGIALIAGWAWRSGRPRLGAAIACVGFLPAPLALSGTVIKDCLMSGLLLCAVGVALWREVASARWARIGLTVAAFGLIVLAAALRYNAFLAGVPLMLALAPTSWTRTLPRLALTALVAALPLLAIGPAIVRLVDAERTGVEQSLIIFDLGGITEHSGINQFPDPGVDDPVAVNHRCYDPYQWDSYSTWAKQPCPIGFEHFQGQVDDEDVDPRAVWLHAIAAHPVAYAAHRLAHFNQSTWFLVPTSPTPTAWTRSVDNPWNFQLTPNRALDAVDAVAEAAGHTPLGWPICWIAVALASCVVGYAAGVRGVPLAVAASAFLYGAGYLVVGVATGMRYYIWTISGAGLAVVLVASAMAARGRGPGRRASLVAAAIVVVPTLLAIAARLG